MAIAYSCSDSPRRAVVVACPSLSARRIQAHPVQTASGVSFEVAHNNWSSPPRIPPPSSAILLIPTGSGGPSGRRWVSRGRGPAFYGDGGAWRHRAPPHLGCASSRREVMAYPLAGVGVNGGWTIPIIAWEPISLEDPGAPNLPASSGSVRSCFSAFFA